MLINYLKVREDSGFKNQEINELEVNITAYITENEQLESEIAKLKDELFEDKYVKYVTQNIIKVLKDN